MCSSSDPNVAFDGFDRVTMTVSFTSSRLSSEILPIVSAPVVDPGLIVKVPLDSMKL